MATSIMCNIVANRISSCCQWNVSISKHSCENCKRSCMKYKSRFDAISSLVAFLCLLHCVLLPLFLTTLPLWGFELLENPLIEAGTVLLSLLVGGYAIRRSFTKCHRNAWVVGAFLLGMSFMVAGNFISPASEASAKLAGACLVIIAHIQNWRLSRRCTSHSSSRGIAFAE